MLMIIAYGRGEADVIILRDSPDFENMISSVVTDCVAWNGYTTCMWHNLITSKIVLDKNGSLALLQEKYRIPYPQKLKENISMLI